jgi:hypothetical protein
MKIVYVLLFACITCSRTDNNVSDVRPEKMEKDSVIVKSHIDTNALTLETRYLCPEGFERVKVDSLSYCAYLRSLKLKNYSHPVMLWNGNPKPSQWMSCGVIDQEIDPINLQQCADAVMRLRGEYLFGIGAFDKISFNFVSDNKPHSFTSHTSERSYIAFRKYMRYVFNGANTSSLKNQLQPVQHIGEIQPGDVFVQSGNPYGHAVTVMDVAVNSEGKKYFLLAQSYMPAQETHFLINPEYPEFSPWYEAKNGRIITPEWEFNSSDLRRFK